MKRIPERTRRLELEVEIEEIKESYNKLKLFINSKTNQDANETVMASQTLKDNI